MQVMMAASKSWRHRQMSSVSGGDKTLPQTSDGGSNKRCNNGGQEITKMSAADKKRRQQRQTRYCKGGCHRQETTMRMGGGSGNRWWKLQSAISQHPLHCQGIPLVRQDRDTMVDKIEGRGQEGV
jgi:hypothetical protein